MAKKDKKDKKIRVTRKMINKLSRLQGLEFTPDELGDISDIPDVGDLLEGQTNIFQGCVDWLHYGGANVDLISVRIFVDFGIYQEDAFLEATEGAAYRRNDGILARNLNEFRVQFEQAANFGHAIIVEVRLGTITNVILARCGCPCDASHASAFPPEEAPDGVADGVDGL